MQVCLSLLGTWHGTDASQKWDPQTSSLFQILLSIQGMILISDPYFNEPNVERMRGQAEGNKASNSYNAEIHLNNIRCLSKLLSCSFQGEDCVSDAAANVQLEAHQTLTHMLVMLSPSRQNV